MNEIIEQRKRKWTDFLNLESNTNRLICVYCSEGLPKPVPKYWELKEERIECAYQTFQKRMEHAQWLQDDSVPYLDMLTGTEIFAEALGAPVHRPKDNLPCAMPLIKSMEELYKIKIPRMEDTNLYILFEMAHKLRERAGKDVPLSLPDVQTPMDIAALLWEKSDFYATMFEEPEPILELAEKIKLFMFDFFDKWFAEFGKDFIAHCPPYYMPYGITMSEDEVGIVNSDMFRDFFAQELNDFGERYGAVGIHCCANANHQWENFSHVKNLRLMNLARTQDDFEKSVPVFKDTCAMWPSIISDENISLEPKLPDKTFDPKAHIAFDRWVKTKEEAIWTLAYYRELFEKT